MSVDPSPEVPLTVIGGYLGAGKTTLLNRLIADPASPRLAVIVNDFGDLNIDEQLIKSRDGDMVSLTNGCVCCSLGDALGDGLAALLQLIPKPEHIVLEASGVAEPKRVAQYGYLTPGIRLAAVVSVADAEMVERQAQDKFVGALVQSQLRDADLIVLSKTDLVSEDRYQQVRAWLDTLVETPRIVDMVQGNLPASILLGEGTFVPSPGDGHVHGPAFSNWSYVSDDVFDAGKVERMLETLSPAIVRVKGFLKCTDGFATVHLAGRRISLEQTVLPGDVLRTQLVFIATGEEMETAELRLSLEACRVGDGN